MAQESKNIVIQHNEDGLPVRIVVNVIDTVTGETTVKVKNYDDLTTEDKAKYDSIVVLGNILI